MAGVEDGALEKDVGRALVDLGIETSHDARKRDGRAPVVGDDGHVGGEGAHLAVEGRELLAVSGGADHDVALPVALGELAEVEGVERLAREVHHVVGHVDDVVDRAGARGDHATGEPLGAWPDLDVPDHAGGVAPAELGVVDGDVDEVVDVGTLDLLHGRQLDVRVLVEAGGRLDGHAGHREAVGTVGRDLAVDHGVGESPVVGEGHAHGGVGRQDDDAVVVGPEAELALRAVHAAGLDAAELALLDLEVAGQDRADHGGHDLVALVEVLGAADDLERDGIALLVDVVLSHVDEAQPHVVGVGVGLLAHDLRRVHVVEVRADLLDGLDLGAGADVLRDEVLGVLGHVDHGLEPLIRNAHCASAFLGTRLGRGKWWLGACPRTGSGSACRRS